MVSERRKQQDDFEKFSALEEDGRRRASERDSIPQGDENFLQRMEDYSNQMGQYFQKMEAPKFATFMGKVGSAAYYNTTAVWKCINGGKTRAECPTTEPVKEKLRDVDFYSKEAIGKRCTWMLDDSTFDSPESPYTLNKFLNDLTACFHRGVEKYGTMAKEWHREGKCMWRE